MLQREFPTVPLAGVGAVIVKDGRILLVQRGTEPGLGRWSIPGGLIEVGESLIEAVVREVREETGLEVEPVELIELLDRIYREEDRVRYHYVIADYLCRVLGGTLNAASDAAAVCWAGREEWNGPASGDLSGHRSLVQDPITARVLEAGWQRAQSLKSQPEKNLETN